VQASRALALAGRALDPNTEGGSDLALAKLLLAHTLSSVAALIDGDDAVRSSSEATAALERSGSLARAAGSAERGRSILAFLSNAEGFAPDRDDLVAVELLLDKVLRLSRGAPAISRAARWGRWGFALLLAGAIAAAMIPVLARLAHGGPWERYKWTASSAASAYSFGTSGLLGAHGAQGLIFHTAFERRPRVTIDLLETRSIHLVELTNRIDCCADRCLPLVVEVAGDDTHFVEVARRNDTFAVWKVEFAARRARYVRLWVDAETAFHLKEIEIR